MKEYNAKIIVDNDNFDILFDCDKEMNNMCNKKNCDYCTYTTDSRYAKAITNKEVEEKMAEGKIEVNINANIIDNNSQYSKVKRRMYNMFHRDLSDKEIIEKLCDEIDYYRGKIIRHEEEHEKDIELINRQTKIINYLHEVNTRFQALSDYTNEDELEQYKKRIKEQNKIIDELYSKTIQSENVMLDTTDESFDEDIEEIITDTIYADGKARKTITEYKYKSDKEAE